MRRVLCAAALALTVALGSPQAALADDAAAKMPAPTVVKSVEGSDTAEAASGGSVSYTVEVALPADLRDHGAYPLAVIDSADAGVAVGDVAVSYAGEDVTGAFDVSFAGRAFTVSCADLLAAVPSAAPHGTLTVSYGATVTGREGDALSNWARAVYLDGASTPEAVATVVVSTGDTPPSTLPQTGLGPVGAALAVAAAAAALAVAIRRRGWRRVLPVLGVCAGLAILAAYPAMEFADAARRSQVAASMDLTDVAADRSADEALLANAEAYNARLARKNVGAAEILPYGLQLSRDGHDTAFGYVKVPSIGLVMPIYRGTSDAALSAGAGHMEGTSLPVGGDSTHAVVTGHSGLEGMRAFDDLRRLEAGDVFGFKVLGRTVCYRVTSTEVVDPDDLSSLEIVDGRDLATLVTCTPYGVNSHRLLIHGERCEVPEGFDDAVGAVESMAHDARAWVLLLAILALLAVIIGRKASRAFRKGRATADGGEEGP